MLLNACAFSLAEVMAAHCSSSSTKAMWRSLQTIEIPCSICEWTACLNEIRREKGMTESEAIQYVLQRIPGDPAAMMRVRSRLLGQVWMDQDVYTGLDVARTSAVFKKYFDAEPVLDGNAWTMWTERRAAFIKSIKAPPLYCRSCGDPLPTTKFRGNSVSTLCPSCITCALSCPSSSSHMYSIPTYLYIQADMRFGNPAPAPCSKQPAVCIPGPACAVTAELRDLVVF